MIDLFPDLPESLSPKEAWKRQHGITTFPPRDDEEMWMACYREAAPGSPHEFGDDEDEALMRLASLLGIAPWQ